MCPYTSVYYLRLFTFTAPCFACFACFATGHCTHDALPLNGWGISEDMSRVESVDPVDPVVNGRLMLS